MSLLIENARIVDPSQNLDTIGSLLVVDGQVAAIGQDAKADPRSASAEVLDATGLLLTPGLIDLHVHFREPGETHKETIATGSRAAAAGGFSTVCAMPNTKPVNDSVATTELMLHRAQLSNQVRYFPIGSVTRGQNGEELADLGTLKGAGCVAFSDDGRPITNGAVMRRALEYAAWLGLPIVAHEEDPTLAAKGYMHEGAVSARLGCLGIPGLAEEVMVARDLALAEATGAHLHLAHLSTASSIQLVREAKQRGVRVSCEVTPHHFSLTDEEMARFDADFKVNPPLRSSKDREALIEGLMDGTVDCIATDHAPHDRDSKEQELPDAPSGMIGLQTAFPLVLEFLVKRRGMGLLQAISLLTDRPAALFHLDLKGLGSLKPGHPADFALFDLQASFEVTPQFNQSKSYNTPFKGWILHGKTVGTWVQGRRTWA